MFVGASSPAAVFVGDTPVSAVYLGDQLLWSGGRWFGVIDAHSGAAGGLTVERPLAGAVASASAATGALRVSDPFRGTIAALSSVSASLSVLKRLAGALAGQSALSGSLNVEKALGGTVAAVSASSSALTVGAAGGFTFVGSSQNAGTTISIPAHQAGDIILIAARRNNNTSATLPSGWENIQNGGANSVSLRVGAVIAADDSTTSGTWTNANSLACVVYRPTSGTAAIGASAMVNGSATPATWSALTLEVDDGTSWVVTIGGGSAPAQRSGITTREDVKPLGSTVLLVGDTDAATDTWSSTTSATSGAWRTIAIELRLA